MDQQPAYQPPLAEVQPPQKSKSSGLAIAALVLGIIGLLTGFLGIGILLGLIAVILGIVSLTTHRGGSGMAIAGISTGGVAVVFGGLFFLITLTAYGGIQNRAETVLNQSTANHIVLQAEAFNAIEGNVKSNHYPSYDELMAGKVVAPGLDADTKAMLHSGPASSVTRERPLAYESCLQGATIYYFDTTDMIVGSVIAGDPEKC